MRTMMLFAVRDRAVDAFNRPFCAPTLGAAERSFHDEVRREESEMHKHPSDYELYCVGAFDEDTGVITPRESPMMVARAEDALG